ncbi:MAG: alkylhydroperoxidase-related (seleno)protein [Pseudomonadota bacterium]|nr:alkylhydroperoxidase-related (seleno)protein [Pseudomonadota bacterium]
MLQYDVEPAELAETYAASHERFWDRLARPGTWLTAAERVAVVEEARAARNCEACARRRAALSPEVDVGEHAWATDLPLPWREVIHRIATDPGRLSSAWFERSVGKDLSHEQYVEILATLVHAGVVDLFCLGIGVDEHPLPAPQAGEPSRHRPAQIVHDEAWVPWIPSEGAVGDEADLWKPAQTANVIRAMSLVPDEVRTLSDTIEVHYLSIGEIIDPRASGDRVLSRAQMELLASRTSALNQCFY